MLKVLEFCTLHSNFSLILSSHAEIFKHMTSYVFKSMHIKLPKANLADTTMTKLF